MSKQKEEAVKPEMAAIFQKELDGQLDHLESLIHKGALQDIKKIVKNIQSSAKIINLFFVFDLTEKLLASLNEIQTLSTRDIEVVKQVIALLRRLAKCPKENISKTIEEIKESAESLEGFFSQVISSEQKAEEKEISCDPALLDLFSTEVESQVSLLNQGLLALESRNATSETTHNLMRAAHSLKGASRVVGLDALVGLAHAMEDCFVALEKDPLQMNASLMDALFQAVDYFSSLVHIPKNLIAVDIEKQASVIEKLTLALISMGQKAESQGPFLPEKSKPEEEKKTKLWNERILRVSSESLNRLMGLAGESVVESLWLEPFGEALLNLKQIHSEIAGDLDRIRESVKNEAVHERVFNALSDLQHHASQCRQDLDSRLSELEMFIRRHSSLSERLYGEVIDIRMRPLSDGVRGFPRYLRDIGKELGKKVRLEIVGETTPVDRDILEKLETPLMHLLRNAVDHGIETPEERVQKGKPEEGVVKLEATHRSGMLYITVSDDGQGVDLEKIKEKVKESKIVAEEVIHNLTDQELLDFLFLPGFSTKPGPTEISGRGMGLNIVQNMIQEVGGLIRTTTTKGEHLTFHLQLPLTLSVIRALLVKISKEPYAFPLARIDRSLYIGQSDIEVVENRQYFHFQGENIGLIQASEIFGIKESPQNFDSVPVIILSDRINRYGVAVDEFIGEKDLVVQEIDPLLGKIPGVSSGAFMEDGSPLLIVDVEDTLRAVDKVFYGKTLKPVYSLESGGKGGKRKRVLIVDDSITVREVEGRLLQNKGYEVQTAVDGMDGWNAVRIGNFDLVITDIDMPRMSGFDLVKSIKNDPRLSKIPVMIVSYKDRDGDRKTGLDVGADYYLTKSSFHDQTLVKAVKDLIGD